MTLEVGGILLAVEVDERALLWRQVSRKNEIDGVELSAVTLAVRGDAVGGQRDGALTGVGVEGAIAAIAILQRKTA